MIALASSVCWVQSSSHSTSLPFRAMPVAFALLAVGTCLLGWLSPQSLTHVHPLLSLASLVVA